MKIPFSFARQVKLGFLTTLLAAILIGILGIVGVHSIATLSNVVVFDNAQELIEVERLRVQSELQVASSRGYLISGDVAYLARLETAKAAFLEIVSHLNASTPQGLSMIIKIKTLNAEYSRVSTELLSLRSKGKSVVSLVQAFESIVQPRREQLEAALTEYSRLKRTQFETGKLALASSSARQLYILVTITILSILLASTLAYVFGRTLIRLYTDAKRATLLREEIVAIVSHDLRNPLVAISLSFELLKKIWANKGDLNHASRAFESGQRAVKQMDRLIESVLDVTRIEGGSLVIQLEPLQVEKLLNEVVTLFMPLGEAKGIRIESSKVDGTVWIKADYTKILQVFSNLIGNALKFAPAGSLIQLEAIADPSQVVFTVTDSGPGIPAIQLPYVFDRFWQAKGMEKKGLGLGLAIVKGIVELHQGHVWVESKLGKWTKFSFSLSRCEDAEMAGTSSGLRTETVEARRVLHPRGPLHP